MDKEITSARVSILTIAITIAAFFSVLSAIFAVFTAFQTYQINSDLERRIDAVSQRSNRN
ncbi:hypothetical protein [Ochrobactrum sp. MC-1LL]|nr:hypothetical protein [Ochrobactrum sp. MC-1LL]